jgi:dTDP-4-amino-4,6-dideoxygalactose transaminase
MTNCEAERSPLVRVGRVDNSTGGQEVPAVQADLARHSETTGPAGVSSGTDALAIGARALGVGAGHVTLVRSDT